jgi:hypothetical protein
LHTIPHLPSAHHETSKRDSSSETKVKEKQNKTIPDLNSNITKSMTYHNQTKELTTWFLSGCLRSVGDEIIWRKIVKKKVGEELLLQSLSFCGYYYIT